MNIREISEKYNIDQFDFEEFIREKGLPVNQSLFSGISIDDSKVEEYVNLFLHPASDEERMRLEEEKKQLQMFIDIENEKMRKATANMLVTSGFNFDGYRIVKYSGYISGDDAMSVNRGYAWGDVSVRDKLMASLTKIRRNALQELKEAAYELGCNAVIGVDFDYITLDPETASIGGSTVYQPYVFCVTANGNAVIIEKIEE